MRLLKLAGYILLTYIAFFMFVNALTVPAGPDCPAGMHMIYVPNGPLAFQELCVED